MEGHPGTGGEALKEAACVDRSRAALTYAEAQTRLEDPNATDELSKSLCSLNKLAQELRRRRTEAGALTLASPEVKFEIDSETHNPLDIGMYQVGCLHVHLAHRYG